MQQGKSFVPVRVIHNPWRSPTRFVVKATTPEPAFRPMPAAEIDSRFFSCSIAESKLIKRGVAELTSPGKARQANKARTMEQELRTKRTL